MAIPTIEVRPLYKPVDLKIPYATEIYNVLQKSVDAGRQPWMTPDDILTTLRYISGYSPNYQDLLEKLEALEEIGAIESRTLPLEESEIPYQAFDAIVEVLRGDRADFEDPTVSPLQMVQARFIIAEKIEELD